MLPALLPQRHYFTVNGLVNETDDEPNDEHRQANKDQEAQIGYRCTRLISTLEIRPSHLER